MADAKVARENFTPMTLVAPFTLMFAWQYWALDRMAINEFGLVLIERNQLPNATTVASLTISLSSSGVTQKHKMLGPEVRVMAT